MENHYNKFTARASKALFLSAIGVALLVPSQMSAAVSAMPVEAQAASDQGQGITVFSNRDAQYRIPAIVECKSGKIIAFTDHRYDDRDIGGGRHLDIVMKISADKGKTWSGTEQIVAKGGSGVATDFDCAHGDAATVVDRKTGRILLMCASGGIGYWESSRKNPLMMGRYYSDDEGKTWKGEEVTKQIYALMPDMESAFFTSGRICQSKQIKVGKYYRVYTVLATHKGNRILYSDDFGQTWAVLGKNVAESAPRGDEAKIEELPDGNVLLSSRVMGGRFFNIYSYEDKKSATGSWGKVAMSGAANHGVTAKGNACNGEVLLVDAKKDGKKVKLLLQSVPCGPERTNVGIYYKALESEDDYTTPEAIAKDWEGCYRVSDTTSAYSTMVQGKDGSVFFLLEENAFRHPETEPDDYYDIRFVKLSIGQITNGKYK